MRVRAVAFDIGGVMVRIAKTWGEARAAAGLGPGGPDGPLSSFAEFDRYQSGLVTDEEYLEALAGFLGGSRADAAQVHRRVLQEPMPGTMELVADVEAAGVVCGCLSNTNALHWGPLVEVGTYPALARLRVKVGSHELRASKPEPAIYRAFEEAVGAGGASVAYFDDVAEYVEGGRAMGWQAWQVPEGDDPVRFMRARLAGAGVALPH
jgi:HAD superfamily hydrolase (TIGR01509 family)